jgi:hypothetical protein
MLYCCLVFYIFLPIRIKFGTGDVHNHLLSDCKFRENLRPESHTLVRGINEFLSALFTCIVRLKCVVRHLHVTLLGTFEFGENWRREGRTFLMGVNEIAWMHVPLQRLASRK